MKNLIFTIATLLLVTCVFAQEGGFHLDKEYKIDSKGLLNLNSSDGKVFITGSTRTNVHVKIDRKITTRGWTWGEDNFRIDVREENGNLKIEEKKDASHIAIVGYYNEEYKIEIEVPEGISLKVRGDDGDYYIKNVNGSIVLYLDDADAELADCKGDNFEFRLDDGDIRMDQGKGKLEVVGDDADIEIYKANFSSVRADIDDGDLIIETSLANNGEYFLESQDGTIALNITGGGGEFNIRHDDANVSTEGNFKMIEKSENETRISLANGTAKVSVRADDARVKLRAN